MPHILIVDDEQYQRILLREILSSDPTFTFADAENGHQALDFARTESFDLVIMDIMMPVLDGVKACKRFKADAALQAIPILLIAASGPLEESIWRAVGAVGFLRKPFAESELYAKVQHGLGSKQQQ